jgi:hypothetical protein
MTRPLSPAGSTQVTCCSSGPASRAPSAPTPGYVVAERPRANVQHADAVVGCGRAPNPPQKSLTSPFSHPQFGT